MSTPASKPVAPIGRPACRVSSSLGVAAKRPCRPTILVSDRQLRDLTSVTIQALETANNPPALFVRSGEVIRIREDEIGRPITEAVNDAILRNYMSRAANFVRAREHRLPLR